ncbi:MAG: uncharacterized protein JWN98_377 [Abditibacteriota bacterium]|nr:uncharacterized protein [Abditibacteriota bacterium]
MKVLISGSTGLLGSALVPLLRAEGHTVVRLVRGQPQTSGEAAWNPSQPFEPAFLDAVDAVFHLSGEPVLGRWSEEKKKHIRESRIDSTRALSEAMAQLPSPPKYFGCASAIGIYGNRGDEVVTEESVPGSGFLAEVCRDWEAATEPASAAGVRVTNFRIGIVLSERGGALATMLKPFQLGLGGSIGSGRQWTSWITRDDLVAAMRFCWQNKAISGPVNLVGPNPVTNHDFGQTLAKVLSRPALLPTPAPLLKLVMGQAAEEMLLAGQKVQPKVLLQHGFAFQKPDLESALRVILRR